MRRKPRSTHKIRLTVKVPRILCIFTFSAVSYNRPKFPAHASWTPNATTVFDYNLGFTSPNRIFINTNNTIYINDYSTAIITAWIEGYSVSMREINDAYGLFVTANDEVYFRPISQCNIYASPINATIIYPVMLVSKCCDDIFIDLNNTLYCSIHFMNQIITKSLDAPGNTLRSVAGTGSPGSESDQLYDPYGIFVDISFDLYVADSVNNRIQRFSSGQMNATTVAGNGTSGTIFLKTPHRHPTGWRWLPLHRRLR